MPSLTEEIKRGWPTSWIGIALLFVGIGLLTWNERQAAHLTHSLFEANNRVVSLKPNEKFRPELDGHLVHITGHLQINEPLVDPEYGVSIEAVKLQKRVQIYQWVEQHNEKDKNPGSKYYYITEWKDDLVDSSFFHDKRHQNPKEIPLKSHIYTSSFAQIGDLMLGDEIKEKFTDYSVILSHGKPQRNDVELHLGYFYHSQNVWEPSVGDIRVQFSYAGKANEIITVIAMQQEGTLVPYVTSKGHSLALLRYGDLTVKQMFSFEHSDVKRETWRLRAFGIFILYLSSIFLAKLIRIIFYRNPVLKYVGTDNMFSPINFALSTAVSFVTIAIAWALHNYYPPILF